MDEWVRVLRGGARLLAARPLRRQGHQHRVLGPDVEGGAGRPGADQVPDQRAGAGAGGGRRSRSTCEFYGGPGVQHIAMATDDIIETVRAMRAQRRVVPPRAAGLLRAAARARRPDRRGPARAGRAGHPRRTATTRATCCRSSPSRSRTARRCSSRSSSATAPGASARATSRRCSRRSSASRPGAGRSEHPTDSRRSPCDLPVPAPSPASATSTPSSSTCRPAGGSAGSTWSRSGTRCRSSTSPTRPA